MDEATRTRIMRSITKTSTKPEMIVRRLVHAMGYRFRLHDRRLPGTPDLVLPRHRKVIQVQGCFWHRHQGCRLARMPRSNLGYWEPKLAGNVERDARTRRQLEQLGWQVLIVWECETRDADALALTLARFLERSSS